MHRVFRSFIDSLSESVDAQDLQSTFSRVSAAFDLPSFACLSMPARPGAEADLISNYPKDWTSYYFQSHYERLDPVVQQAHKDFESFEWGREVAARGISRIQQRFFDEAAEFGIIYGFTIPIHDSRGHVSAVTFAIDEPTRHFGDVSKRSKNFSSSWPCC